MRIYKLSFKAINMLDKIQNFLDKEQCDLL